MKPGALSGKLCVVTGATSGIGRAASLLLATAGARVIGTGRDPARLAALGRDLAGSGEAVALDIARPDEIEGVMSGLSRRHGHIDGIVAAAGVSDAPSLGALDGGSYDRMMDVNVRGAVFTVARALPHLADAASIVLVGSVAGRKGQPSDPLYAGSKGFVRAFARTLGTSPDMMARGIRVNVVSPGPIETPMTRAATADPEIRAYVERLIPMARWGRAKEVAEAILFLLSPAARFTTGAEVTVDGGMAHA